MASDSPEPLSIGEDAGEDRFAELSDLALWDKLRCLQNGLDRGAFGGLPDGGKKILRYCSDIRHEIARRKEVFSALPSPFSSPVDRSAHSKPHRAPVSATATGGEAADEDRYAAIRQLPDQELREMLRRLQNGLDTGLVSELPDGGKKWLQYHRAVRLEIARRQASCSALLRRFPAHSEDKQPQHAPASVSPKLLPSGEAWDEDSRIVAVSKVLIFIAMQTEMLPLRKRFQLVEVPADVSIYPDGAPWTRYHGDYKGLHIDLVWPGKDPVLGVDSVGTLTAALVTYASIQFLKPDLIINAGTAGGFKAKGAGIGDVFLVSDVAFHDRRIPIPVFDMYGVGARKTFMTPNILKELNLKVGKLSTGDSLDMSPHDVSAILSNGATVKDMEGAAVAHVADMFSTPAIFVKAVTDIVDGKKPTAEEFLQNSIGVTKALDQAVTEVVNFISGKCLSDL